MDIFEALGPFWTIGIVLNVGLTGLAIWWVIRSMRANKRHAEDPSDPLRRR